MFPPAGRRIRCGQRRHPEVRLAIGSRGAMDGRDARGAAFFAYADNYLIDVKFGVIMDVEASRAIRQAEVRASKTMIERTEERFDTSPGGSLPIRPTVQERISTGSSTTRRSRHTCR